MKAFLFLFIFCFSSIFTSESKTFSITVKDLTLEQKVGQILMGFFDGEEFNEYGRKLFEKTYLGSYIFYSGANGNKSHLQMQKFTSDLQEYVSSKNLPPLLICCDQEGGRVSTLTKDFVYFPGNGAIGQANDENLAYLSGLYQGYELKSCGVNLNLAPVVDVNNNPNNPIIGVRSFSDTPDRVVKFAKKVIKGYDKASIFYCLKHFPGHGDVTVDSHLGLPVVDKSYEELKKTELCPFYSLAKTAPFIMTAHILFPQIDIKPATLSKKILHGILREDMEYKGVIISDSLTMKGVLQEGEKIEELAVEAFLAGCDLLCIGGEYGVNRSTPEAQVQKVINVYDHLLEAVKKGKISEKRLDESVERILKLKNQTAYFTTEIPGYNKKDSYQVANDIATKACHIVKPAPDVLFNKKVFYFVPDHLFTTFGEEGHTKLKQLFEKVGKTNNIFYYDPKSISFDENKLAKYDTVVFFSFYSWRYEKQKEFIEKISLQKPTYCIGLTENELSLLKNPQMKIATYSPEPACLKAVVDALKSIDPQVR
jgi:beta-N-acetylhexosaminidase